MTSIVLASPDTSENVVSTETSHLNIDGQSNGVQDPTQPPKDLVANYKTVHDRIGVHPIHLSHNDLLTNERTKC